MNGLGRTFLIYGASRGLGKAIVNLVPEAQDKVYGVSRSIPKNNAQLNWICADLSTPEDAVDKVKKAVKDEKIDVLIYNVGIWENNAFTENYNFEEVSSAELNTILNTNINTCIQSLQSLIENLKLSDNAKVILIGSTWGVDNHNGKELVFSATKYALRGIAQSLREILRNDLIGVSVLNLGYLATEYEADVPTATVLAETNHALIPLSDVILAIKFIISTSNASCVKEILMPAMKDENI